MKASEEQNAQHSDYLRKSAALLPWVITVKQHLPSQRLFCFSFHVFQNSSMPAVIPRWSLCVCVVMSAAWGISFAEVYIC